VRTPVPAGSGSTRISERDRRRAVRFGLTSGQCDRPWNRGQPAGAPGTPRKARRGIRPREEKTRERGQVMARRHRAFKNTRPATITPGQVWVRNSRTSGPGARRVQRLVVAIPGISMDPLPDRAHTERGPRTTADRQSTPNTTPGRGTRVAAIRDMAPNGRVPGKHPEGLRVVQEREARSRPGSIRRCRTTVTASVAGLGGLGREDWAKSHENRFHIWCGTGRGTRGRGHRRASRSG